MQAQFGTQRPKSQAPPRREGEVRIEHPDNRSRRNYDDEEYTSYTEVK
jgi:hypothetical protein